MQHQDEHDIKTFRVNLGYWVQLMQWRKPLRKSLMIISSLMIQKHATNLKLMFIVLVIQLTMRLLAYWIGCTVENHWGLSLELQSS